MAAIHLKDLVNNTVATTEVGIDIYNKPNSTYKDIHLDMQVAESIGIGTQNRISRDIQADVDTEAIKNSLRNLFTTRPGEKVLSPLFGCNLEQNLFEAITDFNAQTIGNEIYRQITSFDNRVTVQAINVRPSPDENTYYINIQIEYPRFDNIKSDTLNLTLGLNSFTIS